MENKILKSVAGMIAMACMLAPLSLPAATDITHPYTWSEAQCIVFGLLGFAAIPIGLILVFACFCAGIRTIREWFKF